MAFNLSDNFLNKYKRKKPNFGFNGLSELTYRRTYSRPKTNGDHEEWWETVKRVVEGTYEMQQEHILKQGLDWNSWKAQISAQEMYDRIFTFKFLPPGRGLWAMGTPIVKERKLYAALNNCAFVSTETIKDDLAKPFLFTMDMLMLGVGVGFDVKGSGKITIKGINTNRGKEIYVIEDSREAWVESVQLLIESFLLHTQYIEFDYSKIRKEGEKIHGFGGTSSGPEPLKKLHKQLRSLLEKSTGDPISTTVIVDIMNLIGKCVVAGNVRRTAEIALGFNDEEYLNLKNYKLNPHREQYGWTSNNTIFADLGMDYKPICERIIDNGEPGLFWLQNARDYSRIRNGKDKKDHRVTGANPCMEQSLESYELCCLVENFPAHHDSLEDFLKTLKFSYLYAKTVTLGKTHWPMTNRVMLRNRRIGCSLSGIAQFIGQHGTEEFKQWMKEGYDKIQEYDEMYSDWFAIPRSIKTTSIKPSGTVSIVAAATPGMHYPQSRFYIRRIQLSRTSPLINPLKKAGYKIEKAFGSEDSTVVAEIPVDIGDKIRTVKDISMWEQLSLAAFIQKYWADNQVSCTVTFDPETEGHQIESALNYFQYQLKSISFLPNKESGAYKQMPYEEINEQTYKKIVSKITPIKWGKIKNQEIEIDKFCSNDKCDIN